jgi:hypothetical protein
MGFAAQYLWFILFETHPQPFPTSREGSYGLQGLIFFWTINPVFVATDNFTEYPSGVKY